MDKHKVVDTIKVGEWEEVEKLELRTITKNDKDTEQLNGLILKGYEMKWGAVNANGEKYDKGAFDNFIQSYFVEKGFNMPLTLEHQSGIDNLCGKVLYIETNSVGFYFVAYIPRTFVNYNIVKNLLREGILQGFSKEGWATDYTFDKDDVMVIKQMEVVNVSLVSTPANGLKLEKVAETPITDGLTFKKADEVEGKNKDLFDELFS